jgi:hypothetical protein
MEDAIDQFRAALRLAPESEEVRRNFSAVLRALGKDPDAEELISRRRSTLPSGR